ncbi:MAG: DUF484 family protein [Pseudomonadales bacterium]|jgi:uncharacterized protein YigA (DUF484 family)|nr:DUF484 family protein [Pseudomonadales bacterium]
MKDDAATSAAAAPGNDLHADEVAAWLADHPEFFASRDALLADLVLPHAAGDAVSLVERQLAVLRDRNAELHRRLQHIMETARANHRIFERTLEITAALLDASDVADLVRRLREGLTSGFEVDATTVRVVDLDGLKGPLTADAVDANSAGEAVGSLLRPGNVFCGVLRDTELAFLFGARAERVASAAVMPVELPGGVVVIALGSADADHFRPEMGTLFLRFLGDTLRQRLLQLDAATGSA